MSDIEYLIGQVKEKVEGIPERKGPFFLNDMDMKTLYEYEKSLQNTMKVMKKFM